MFMALLMARSMAMAPSMATVLQAPSQTGRFEFVLYIIWMFLVLDVVCLIVYNRQTLLEIGSTVTHHKPDFPNTDPLFTNNTAEPFVWAARPRRRKRSWRRGKRAGVLVRLRRRADRPPLASILLANIQPLDNKLWARISFQCEIRDCSIICLTETWMSREGPDFAIEPTGFSVHRADRIPDLSGKSKGGGVCFMINNYWWNRKNAHPIQSLCSLDLEYLTLLCRTFWLPRKFTMVIITAVYIPPQANTDAELKELYGHLCKQETVHPDAAFIITRDFNKAYLRRIAPKFFQHISCNTRGKRTLGHCYSPFQDAYNPSPAHLSANQITLPFCSCMLTGRSWNGNRNLTWTTHTQSVVRKAHQHLFFLRRLEKFGLSSKILRQFYSCTV